MKKVTLKDIANSWDGVIARLENKNSKVAHFLEEAKPHSFDGEQVLIELKNGMPFHLKTLEKDVGLVESILYDILDYEIKIKFYLSDNSEKKKERPLPVGRRDIALELLDNRALLKVVSDRLQTVDTEFTEYREVNKDKIDFYDRLAKSKNTIEFSKAAKLLKYDDFGRKKLFAFCREQGYLRYRPGTPAHNEPYQRYVNQGLFEVEIQSYTANGKEQMGTKTVFTQKGFDYIRKLLDEYNDYE